MGEHVRSVWRALTEVGISTGIVDIYGPQGAGDAEFIAPFAASIMPDLGSGTNIYCINGDEVAGASPLGAQKCHGEGQPQYHLSGVGAGALSR